jgi:molecular chaperone HtpG
MSQQASELANEQKQTDKQTGKKTLSFQTEVAQLLHLVTHSLYSNPDIFLRELISNASDACDKWRYESLQDPQVMADQGQDPQDPQPQELKEPSLQVRIELDEVARTLTITDNGIGLSAQEAIDNLGTIAKSGTRAFVEKLKASQTPQADLIGQFGVGFYSGFIVADRITVESRRAGLPTNQGVRWVSEGTGQFEVETIERQARGTSVILHLKDSAQDYLNAWKLRQIITCYSDHISLPIQMRGQPVILPKDAPQASQEEGNDANTVDEVKPQASPVPQVPAWETVNQANALWTRPKKDITEAQYYAFYKQLAQDSEDPLTYTHNKVEGTVEYTQLLFIPSRLPFELMNSETAKHGLKLYVRRVFIMDRVTVLLPNYLRFVRGVVDANDLPLNVSRELLQESRDARAIREGCTKRVLSLIEELAQATEEDKKEKFETFYTTFSSMLKEGLAEDVPNRSRIMALLRFASTEKSASKAQVSFADYKARMKPNQKAIYYVTADSLAIAQNTPQLEVFRKKGIEVLFMTERIDEWAMAFLPDYEGIPLRSIARGQVDLGDLEDEEEKKASEEAAQKAAPLVARLQAALQDCVQEVRATNRLVDSPACLVVNEHAMSLQMNNFLKQAGHFTPQMKPILEINPTHTLIARLETIPEGAAFEDWARILYDQAILADGLQLSDPMAYIRRVNTQLLGN